MNYFDIKKKWFIDALVDMIAMSITIYVATDVSLSAEMEKINVVSFSATAYSIKDNINVSASASSISTITTGIQDDIVVEIIDASANAGLMSVIDTELDAVYTEFYGVPDAEAEIIGVDGFSLSDIEYDKYHALSSSLSTIGTIDANITNDIEIPIISISASAELGSYDYLEFSVYVPLGVDGYDIDGTLGIINVLDMTTTVYSTEVVSVEATLYLYTYMVFSDLYGLEFDDLNGLIFSDLLYNR